MSGCADQYVLFVRCRSSCNSEVQKRATNFFEGSLTLGRSNKGTNCFFDVTDCQLEHRHIRLTRDRRKSKIQVGACRHLTIAGHIPCGCHDDATGQRIGDRRNVLCCELEGFGVHADLRVCQIAVVQQNQLGTSKARGSRNNGACAVNIELLPEDLLQRTIFSGRVAGDGHAVRA
ncbi:Uncharacterised protein [Chlamydia trachomatis]|nr:Uncharacterised protein [Chlamydia trachomatis]